MASLIIITNNGYLHCTILKALYIFMVKRTHRTRDNKFIFQNVQNEISEIFKNVQTQHEILQSSLLN